MDNIDTSPTIIKFSMVITGKSGKFSVPSKVFSNNAAQIYTIPASGFHSTHVVFILSMLR